MYAVKTGAAGAAGAAAWARYGLAWQEPQIIGAGVLLRAALGVMNENALRFACRFDAMTRGAKALEKVTLKGGGVYLSPCKYMINGLRLRYLPTG